jgi:hypothetical protein
MLQIIRSNVQPNRNTGNSRVNHPSRLIGNAMTSLEARGYPFISFVGRTASSSRNRTESVGDLAIIVVDR